MSMTAVVGEQANGAQLLTYFITVNSADWYQQPHLRAAVHMLTK